jgi:hypothetical protein
MHRRFVARFVLVAALALAALPAGIAGAQTCPITLPQGSDPANLDPADFGGPIDNPYLPWAVGARWIYRETDRTGDVQTVTVTVTTRTRTILEIAATVVHDKVTAHGELVENTFDWYAQDSCGNVWYLGENTKEYENGVVVTTEGSWEAGVDGAEAGVIMPADPQVGQSYRQEHYAGHAEDDAAILSLDEQAETPFGHFTGVILSKETTPLSPDSLEYKLYAKGIGEVMAIAVSGGSDREELLSYSLPA